PGDGAADLISEPPVAAHGSSTESNFLPFAASSEVEATYLRQVLEQGGEAARNYKLFSYELLELEVGQRVLDIGCGIGTDLLPLAWRVGDGGHVTGLDFSAERLDSAKETIGKQCNIHLSLGNAEQMPFADSTFHRVRADRVLLHVPDLRQALSEMWRVL